MCHKAILKSKSNFLGNVGTADAGVPVVMLEQLMPWGGGSTTKGVEALLPRPETSGVALNGAASVVSVGTVRTTNSDTSVSLTSVSNSDTFVSFRSCFNSDTSVSLTSVFANLAVGCKLLKYQEV